MNKKTKEDTGEKKTKHRNVVSQRASQCPEKKMIMVTTWSTQLVTGVAG